MDLDTRWKKYKYSGFNKFLCVFIACVLSVAFIFNLLSLFNYINCFGIEAVVDPNKATIYNTHEFCQEFSDDIDVIISDVSHRENQKAYDLAKKNTVDRAVEIFEEAKKHAAEQGESLEETKAEEGYYGDNFDAEVTTAVNNYDWESSISNKKGISSFTNNAYGCEFYLNCIDEQEKADVYFEADYSLTAEEAREVFNTKFGNTLYYHFCHNAEDAGESSELKLKNIKFYAEYTDGSVATNVENRDEFIENIRNTNYFILNEGVTESNSISDNLKIDILYRCNPFYGKTLENTKLYVSIDNTFANDDSYGTLANEVSSINGINVNKCIAYAAASLIGILIFMIISVCLAGHKNNEIKTTVIEKLPNDIHLVFNGIVVFNIVSLIIYLFDISYQSHFMSYNKNIYYSFVASGWFQYALAAATVLLYLVVLEFASSISRSIKAGKNIFKNTLIFMLFKLIIKVAKLAAKKGKKFFAVLIYKHRQLFAVLIYKHRQLKKSAVLAVILYTLFNISFVLLIVLLFSFKEFFLSLLAVIGILIVLGADAYLVYRVLKYMKLLDMIISASKNREPLEINTDTLPKSLKILADSLEATNAELQNAVIKAVKDERTKAELITNVSHDLKTPLTSVINYIDLLKKCDIEDETAQKYMAVIDEKSIKLKRLIEDLIEASKVSTGNVTINKAKLNLNELAAQAVVEETADIEKNNLKIIFDESNEKHIVFADGAKIYRVFENLISNARKYSAAGSRIYAGVYSDDKFGYFEIKNISKDPLNISAEELTERFVRGDKSRTEDGNGLGLSIAKELCILNGGELIITIDGDLFKATVKLPKE